MKKLFFAIALFFCVGSTQMFAQSAEQVVNDKLKETSAQVSLTPQQEIEYKAVHADFQDRRKVITDDTSLTARQKSEALNAWRADLKIAINNILN